MFRKSELINQRPAVSDLKPKNRLLWICIIALCLYISLSSQVFAQNKAKITLLVGASNSYKVSEAISEVVQIPEVANRYAFYFYTDKDLENEEIEQEIIAQSRILIVDIMHRNLAKYVLNNVNFEKTKAYGVRKGATETEKNQLEDLPARPKMGQPSLVQ